MSIMVDTSAWYAVCDASDTNHGLAKSFYERITETTIDLLTTDAILVEMWALLAARLGRVAAIAFWQTLRETAIPIITVEHVDIEAAWHIMHTFPDQDFSFTDCTTFAIMERAGIDRAFAFDRHFRVYRYGSGRIKAFACEP